MAAVILHNVFKAARPLRQLEASAFMQTCRSRSMNHRSLASHSICAQSSTAAASVRFFSVSPKIRATVVSKNPRMDEDGNEMAIVISERAAKVRPWLTSAQTKLTIDRLQRLKQITSAPAQKNTLTGSSASPSDSHLRVTVTSGGCHGFQYLMSLEGSDKIDTEEDTIFAFEDSAESGGTAQVVLDESSLELLKGSTVDFTTELIGSQFKIVGNPRATSSCGCGTSFDIE